MNVISFQIADTILLVDLFKSQIQNLLTPVRLL